MQVPTSTSKTLLYLSRQDENYQMTAELDKEQVIWSLISSREEKNTDMADGHGWKYNHSEAPPNDGITPGLYVNLIPSEQSCGVFFNTSCN